MPASAGTTNRETYAEMGIKAKEQDIRTKQGKTESSLSKSKLLYALPCLRYDLSSPSSMP
jgi:hypothetical protein